MVEREISVCGRVAARVREGSIPEFAIWDDVGTFDGKPWRGIVSILSAGFPCQPFSVAGKRKGTGDERWIWPEIARIIGEVQPEIVFLENVPGLLLDPDSDFDRWEVDGESDDSIGGMGTILRDLAGLRFNAEWCCVRASDVGASHGRKRVFILAYREIDNGRPKFATGLSAANGWGGSSGIRGAMEDTEHSGPSCAGAAPGPSATAIDAVRPDGPLGNAERTERRPGAIRSECDSAGINREGEAPSRVGNGEPVLADSSSSGPSIRRDDIGIRECQTVERAGSELGDSGRGHEGRPQSESERECSGPSVTENANRELGDSESGRSGIVREPSGSIGQPDGAELALEDSSRSGEYRLDGESGRIGGRGIRAPDEQLGTSDVGNADQFDGGLVRRADNGRRSEEIGFGGSIAGLGDFAPGPQYIGWADVLLRRPWLRPSWSQAEVESTLRPLAHELADFLVNDRTSALRTLGNGVVPAQAAWAFITLARRAGLICRGYL
jgi:site-specific DNA-cytosine methylase